MNSQTQTTRGTKRLRVLIYTACGAFFPQYTTRDARSLAFCYLNRHTRPTSFQPEEEKHNPLKNIDLQRVALLEDSISSLSTFDRCIDFCPHYLFGVILGMPRLSSGTRNSDRVFSHHPISAVNLGYVEVGGATLPSSRHRNTSFRHSLYSPFPSSFDREGATLFCHGEYFDAPHGTGLAELPHPALQLPSLHRH